MTPVWVEDVEPFILNQDDVQLFSAAGSDELALWAPKLFHLIVHLQLPRNALLKPDFLKIGTYLESLTLQAHRSLSSILLIEKWSPIAVN